MTQCLRRCIRLSVASFGKSTFCCGQSIVSCGAFGCHCRNIIPMTFDLPQTVQPEPALLRIELLPTKLCSVRETSSATLCIELLPTRLCNARGNGSAKLCNELLPTKLCNFSENSSAKLCIELLPTKLCNVRGIVHTAHTPHTAHTAHRASRLARTPLTHPGMH